MHPNFSAKLSQFMLNYQRCVPDLYGGFYLWILILILPLPEKLHLAFPSYGKNFFAIRNPSNRSQLVALNLTWLIGHHNTLVRITNYFHTPPMFSVCVNLIHKWRNIQVNVDSEWKIWETFHVNFTYFQSFCQKDAER